MLITKDVNIVHREVIHSHFYNFVRGSKERVSDIINLQWPDFGIAPDPGYYMRIRTQKAKVEATLPLITKPLNFAERSEQVKYSRDLAKV